MKLTHLKPIGGFCAEASGAGALFLATYLGIPVSTTHTITGSILGVGSVTNAKGVRWNVASRILWAWLLTVPASGVLAAIFLWGLDSLFLTRSS
jgi:inorganic phosphate transporter, PiT family